MPQRQVALLRGINVGRAKRVAMADLRTLVEGLGYTDVRTLLNSGNVVFTSPRANVSGAAGRIEKALAAELGVSARITVISSKDLATAVTENPLLGVAEDPARHLVAVLADPNDRPKLEALAGEDWAPEVLAVGYRVAYLWCAGGILESRLLTAIGRAFRDAVTTRNWATILKLRALAEDGQE